MRVGATRKLVVIGALTMAVLILLGAMSGTAAALGKREKKLVRLINNSREDAGLDRLKVALKASEKADNHSKKMAAAAALFHSCSPCPYGENVGVHLTVRKMHDAFMGSPGHRANILGGGFEKVAVGIYKSGGILWVTERFLF